MNVNEIIRKWYQLSSGDEVDTNDVFFRFMAVWVAFNALYTYRYGRLTNQAGRPIGDRHQVREFAKEAAVEQKHIRLLRDDAEYKEAVIYLKSKGVSDVATGRHWCIHDETNVLYVMMCVYQVRCNLFHGGKLPDSARDARVVSASYTVVSRLLEGEVVGYTQQQRTGGTTSRSS